MELKKHNPNKYSNFLNFLVLSNLLFSHFPKLQPQQKNKEILTVIAVNIPSIKIYYRRQPNRWLTVGPFMLITIITDGRLSVPTTPDNITDEKIFSRGSSTTNATLLSEPSTNGVSDEPSLTLLTTWPTIFVPLLRLMTYIDRACHQFLFFKKNFLLWSCRRYSVGKIFF